MNQDTELLVYTLGGNIFVFSMILIFFKEVRYYRGDIDNQKAKKF